MTPPSCPRQPARPARQMLRGLALLSLLFGSLYVGWEACSVPATAGADGAALRRQRHLIELGADRWHAQGQRGQGVKVAVLDTGFRGYRGHLGKALPARVTVRSFRADGDLEARDSQHGILCGEVIHAIAPEADLLFANWDLGRSDQFLAAVRWARGQGARLVSCSVITPSWSDGAGGGRIHQVLARLLGPGDGRDDLLCVASAGNTADRHWGGAFHDDGDDRHLWQPDRLDNRLSPWGEDQVAVELYGPPGSAYVLSIHEATTDRRVAEAVTDPQQPDRTSAVVRFWPEEGHGYRVRVQHGRGAAGLFHVVTMNASLACTTPGANVCFPADGPEVVALGAVDGAGRRAWWSACGAGTAPPKPDLVAIVPFPSLWRERPFSGTSAAAPQAAGLAALWWGRHPDGTAAQVRAALRAAARDLGTPGPDSETGYGLIRLPSR